MDQWQPILDGIIPSVDQSAYHEEQPSEVDKDHYCLYGHHGRFHLTNREAECVFHLLQGRTIKETAAQLSLSPRTVEFYVKNVRMKMGAISKADLIERVMRSGLPQRLDASMG